MNDIAIIGAGGHTRSSISLLKESFPNASFVIYDDSYNSDTREHIDKIFIVDSISKINNKNCNIFLSIGDNKKREMYFNKFKKNIINDNLVHPSAYMEKNIRIGVANQIYANSYINSFVNIGDNNILNTSSILEHEVKIGSHNHISVGTKLCGRVIVGNRCFIGAGSVIIDKVSICDDVIIGAGSVVIKDITSSGTYVGNPVRRIK